MKRLALTGGEKEMDEASWKLQQEYGKLAFVEYSGNRAVNALYRENWSSAGPERSGYRWILPSLTAALWKTQTGWGSSLLFLDHVVDNCLDMEPGRPRFIRVKAKCAYGFEVLVFQNPDKIP